MSAWVLLLALAAAGPPPVSLHLTAAQEVLLVGEPLRLNLRVQAHRTVALPPEPGWESTEGGVQVWIATGEGEREYTEAISSVACGLTIMDPLPAGREAIWDFLLHMGFYGQPRGDEAPQLAFAHEGTYKVQIWSGRDGWVARSNWITVTVTEPQGEDRALLAELGRDVRALKYGSVARRLLEQYPRSPYLHLASVHAFGSEETAAWTGLDLETGRQRPDFAALGPAELTRARQEGARRLARRLAAEPHWGAFEDVRLGFLERHARFSGDVETAERAARELRARYPHSPMTRALEVQPR